MLHATKDEQQQLGHYLYLLKIDSHKVERKALYTFKPLLLLLKSLQRWALWLCNVVSPFKGYPGLRQLKLNTMSATMRGINSSDMTVLFSLVRN